MTDFQLSGDVPGDDPLQDVLGYAPIAKNIAKSICRMAPPEGLVLAIYGPWGSGKSTCLNYIEKYIGLESNQNKPIILRFNPWWFSGHEDLAEFFIEELGEAFSVGSKHLKKAGKLLKDLAACVADSPVPINIGAFGVSVNSKDVAKAAGERMSGKTDVPTLKRKIGEKITLSGERVLIIIDDIDRLTSDEIRHLFKTIKALGDFRNVIYLLAFDKEVVSAAVSTMQGSTGSGSEYLDKIVQVPFELPVPDPAGLQHMFFEHLDKLFDAFTDGSIDEQYFGNMYLSGVDRFLQTPRDVVRFINSLSVTYPAIAKEVNPVDFMGVEILRVFCSKAYETIRRNPEFFTGYATKDSSRPAIAELKEFHNRWIEEVPEPQREHAKSLLMRLFPKIESVWGRSNYGPSYEEAWRKQLQVCSADNFDVYFRFGVPNGNVTLEETKAIVSPQLNAKDFGKKLLNYSESSGPREKQKLPQLLQRLEDIHEGVTPTNLAPMIRALIEYGDQLISTQGQQRSVFELTIEMRLIRLLTRLISRVAEAERFELIKAIFTHTVPSFTQVYLLRTLSTAQGKTGSSFNYADILSEQQVSQLEKLMIKKICKNDFDWKSFSKLKLPMVLNELKSKLDYLPFDSVRTACLSDDSRFTFFLESYLQESHRSGMGDKVAKKVTNFGYENLCELINPAVLIERAKALQMRSSPDVTERQLQALTMFINDYEAGNSGDSGGQKLLD